MPKPHAFKGNFCKSLWPERWFFPTKIHAAGVAVEAIFNDCYVNIDSIAGFEAFCRLESRGKQRDLRMCKPDFGKPR